jgi:hypothetical protein
MMQGRRLSDGTDWSSEWQPGDYAKRDDRYWLVNTPNSELALIDSQRWKVTEHEDGTVTMSPSILISAISPTKGTRVELWHGFLERGIFRSC